MKKSELRKMIKEELLKEAQYTVRVNRDKYEVDYTSTDPGIGTIKKNGSVITIFEFDPNQDENNIVKIKKINNIEVVDALDSLIAKFG